MPDTFALNPDLPLRDAARRLAVERIDAALIALAGVGAVPDVAVHETRKRIKEIRALLRLMQGGLPAKEFERENELFRHVGRLLAPARDSAIYPATLAALRKSYDAWLQPGAFDSAEARLIERRDREQGRLIEENGDDRAASALRYARGRAADWQLRVGGFALIGEGLRKSYDEGQRAMERTLRTEEETDLHEWRKRVKDLWYQMQMIGAASSEQFAGYAIVLEFLADRLGSEHDRAVLREVALDDPSLFIDRAERELLVALIDRERRTLRKDAFNLGRRIYAANPRDFIDRVFRFWKKRTRRANREDRDPT